MSTDKTFTCTDCSKAFVTERNLVRHQTSCAKRQTRPPILLNNPNNPTNPSQPFEDEIIALRAQVQLLKEERLNDIEWLKRQVMYLHEERKRETDWLKHHLRTLQDQMFEIAKIPNHNTTTTNFVGDLQMDELSKYIAPAIAAANAAANGYDSDDDE
jgi:hypothetical protein